MAKLVHRCYLQNLWQDRLIDLPGTDLWEDTFIDLIAQNLWQDRLIDLLLPKNVAKLVHRCYTHIYTHIYIYSIHDPASELGDLLGEAPRLLVSKVASFQWHSYSAVVALLQRGTLTAP